MFLKIIKILGICGVLLSCLASSHANAASVPEYYAKGLFLLKVFDFVQWPDDLIGREAEKKLCIYGENPFSDYLQEINNAIEKKVILQYTDDINQIDGCHILYISQSEKYKLKDILSFFANKPILTVSDIDKFAYKNGMIELSLHSRRKNIQLRVNLDAVNHSRLKMSSNLIELAIKTYGENTMVVLSE